jgi:hypothetical protein
VLARGTVIDAKARARKSFALSRHARRDRTVAGVSFEDMFSRRKGEGKTEVFPERSFFANLATSRSDR